MAIRIRAIDYYIKNLPFDVRQEVYKKMKKVNPTIVNYLLERDMNYPSFRKIVLSEEGIEKWLAKSTANFEAVNNVMTENERYPLFEDAADTYKSAAEYVELLKLRTDEELVNMFGCTWEEYTPKIYKK